MSSFCTSSRVIFLMSPSTVTLSMSRNSNCGKVINLECKVSNAFLDISTSPRHILTRQLSWSTWIMAVPISRLYKLRWRSHFVGKKSKNVSQPVFFVAAFRAPSDPPCFTVSSERILTSATETSSSYIAGERFSSMVLFCFFSAFFFLLLLSF